MTIKADFQTSIPPRLLTACEVAQVLNISKSFAYLLLKRGDIPTVRLGRAVRVRPLDLEQFILSKISSRDSASSNIQIYENRKDEV